MCTTAAKQLDNSWFLIKTRDPVSWMRWDDEIKLFNSKDDKFKKLIIQNPNPHEDGYYGGLNEKGVAFVSTFVPVAENQIPYLRRPYIRLILDALTAKEAVEIIKTFYPHIGGNMFVADKDECYGIEGVPREYFIEKISSPAVKTNHFVHLPDKNLEFATDQHFQKWTNDHYDRATKLISTANNIKDFQQLLRDRANAENKTAICTTRKENECFTHSAFIFDTRNCRAYYCQGNPLENDFQEYSF
jgi:predicted choloylglycine hydrolase